MAKLSTHQVREVARKIIATNPGGVKYGDLHEQISEMSPETPKNTIHGSIWDLHLRFPQEISKPSRGLFVPGPAAPAKEDVAEVVPEIPKQKEEDFYAPFAEWLK